MNRKLIIRTMIAPVAAVLAGLALAMAGAPGEAAAQGFGATLTAPEVASLESKAGAGDVDAIDRLARNALSRPMRHDLEEDWSQVTLWLDVWDRPLEAAAWWRKGAALGDTRATMALGHLYGDPWGVPQDLAEATRWMEKAAALGRVEAMVDLGHIYGGEWGGERDEVKEVYWFKRAAALGDQHSMFRLAMMYDLGLDVARDGAEAARWYEAVIAAKGPGADDNMRRVAMNNLGGLYEEGRGVPKDEAHAAALYREAGAGKGPITSYNLAVLCETGRGVPRDLDGALWLYRRAALDGLPEAVAALERFGVHNEATMEERYATLNAHAEKTKDAPKDACHP